MYMCTYVRLYVCMYTHICIYMHIIRLRRISLATLPRYGWMDPNIHIACLRQVVAFAPKVIITCLRQVVAFAPHVYTNAPSTASQSWMGGGCLTHFKLIRRLRRHISLKRSAGMGGWVVGERGQGGGIGLWSLWSRKKNYAFFYFAGKRILLLYLWCDYMGGGGSSANHYF